MNSSEQRKVNPPTNNPVKPPTSIMQYARGEKKDAEKVLRPERLTLAQSRDLFYEKFRTNLRILCGSVDKSMISLSEEMGLRSGKRITDLQYGHRGNPTMEELHIITKYFGITIDDILYKTAKISFV